MKAKKKKSKKKAAKKAVKKVAPPKEVFAIEMQFNGETYSGTTDNIREAILSVKPIFLKTRVLFKAIKEDGRACERILTVPEGKKVFMNVTYMTVFLNRLIFK